MSCKHPNQNGPKVGEVNMLEKWNVPTREEWFVVFGKNPL